MTASRSFSVELLFKADTSALSTAVSQITTDLGHLGTQSGAAAAAAVQLEAATTREARATAQATAAVKDRVTAQQQLRATAGAPAGQTADIPVPDTGPTQAALDDLRAAYVPVYAAQRAYEAQIERIKAAEGQGAISTEESAAAQARLQRAYDQTMDRLQRADGAVVAQTRSLDELRAAHVPLYAAERRHEAALADIRAAQEAGALSADEAAAAIQRQQRAHDQTVARLQAADQATQQQVRSLDEMRAAHDPLYAAERRHEAVLADIRTAQAAGALSADQATAAIQRQQRAYDQSVERIRRADAALLASADTLDDLRAAYVPTIAAQRDYEAQVKRIQDAEAAGALTRDEAAAAQTRVRYAYDETIERIQRSDAVMIGHASSMKLTGHEARNLTYQLNDVFQSLALGMSPTQVLLQQGPQIVQIYGSVGATMQALTSALTLTRVAVGGVTAVVGGGLLAWRSYLTSTKEVATAARGLGAAVAGSAGEMEAAARAGADAAGISIAAARSMEAAFLRSGQIGSEVIAGLIGVSKDFAATIGIDAASAGDALAELFSDPAAAAEKLWRQYGLIDGATARYATQLASQNRLVDAQSVLLAALPKRLADAAEATTAWGRAWGAVSRGASDAWQWVGETIDRAIYGPSDLEERISRIQGQLDKWQPRQSQSARQALQTELDGLLAEQARRDEAQRQARLGRLGTAASGIADQSPATARRRQAEGLRNDITALQAGLVDTGLDATQVADINRAIEAKSNALAGLETRQARLVELDQLDVRIAAERNPLLRAELEARRTRLQMADQEVSTAEAETSAARARAKVIAETLATAGAQAEDLRAEADLRAGLTAQVAAGTMTQDEANTRLQAELALRPLVAAAVIAEGRDREGLLAVIERTRAAYAGMASAERMMSAVGNLADLSAETEVRARLNAEVAAGASTQDEANRRLREEIELRPLVIAAAAAEGAQREVLLRIIERTRAASAAAARAQQIGTATGQLVDLRTETQIRERLARQVEAGAVRAEDVTRLLQEEVTLRALATAAAAAEGDQQATLLRLIAETRSAYEGRAIAEREATRSTGWQDYIRAHAEALEQLRVERALIGASNEDRERGIALLEAEREIRRQRIDPRSDRADQIRAETRALAEQRREVERQSEAWSDFRGAAEDAIDGAVEALRKGDLGGLGDSFAQDLTSSLFKQGISNPIKNAVLGTDYATVGDIGGLSSIWDRLTGGSGAVDAAAAIDPQLSTAAAAMSTAAMTVTAGTVTVTGAGVVGAAGPSLVGGAANDVVDEASAKAAEAMGDLGAAAKESSSGLGLFGQGLDWLGSSLSSLFSGGGGGGLIGSLIGSIPGFASGGHHSGGLRLVGEQGPEIEYTGPSTIVPADLTRQILTARTQLTVINAAAAATTGQQQAQQPVSISVHNYSGASVETRERTDARGQRQIDFVIGERVGKAVSQPGAGAQRAMAQTYGLKPLGVDRG
ncbi:phage tail length tape measure family protein [Tistrella bauzanensis]|uniref:phage tail length tape measure family protein n=1 Tax=Tistrella TaxID=171436 RepID=UPI0031F673FF